MSCSKGCNSGLESFRGSEFTPGPMEGPSGTERSFIPRSLTASMEKGTEKTAAEREREERLEAFMNEIKSFIRKIDVTSL